MHRHFGKSVQSFKVDALRARGPSPVFNMAFEGAFPAFGYLSSLAAL